MNRQDEEIILPKNDIIYNYFQTIYPQKSSLTPNKRTILHLKNLIIFWVLIQSNCYQ